MKVLNIFENEIYLFYPSLLGQSTPNKLANFLPIVNKPLHFSEIYQLCDTFFDLWVIMMLGHFAD